MREYLWVEDRDYYKNEELTQAKVIEAESILGVKLPESYINALKAQNGGSIRYDTYPSPKPTTWAHDHVSIDHIRGIGKKNGILESAYLIEEWNLPKDIVIFCGDGHWWVCFDYRKCKQQREPSILYLDLEGKHKEIELAPNFSEFLNGLVDGTKFHIYGFNENNCSFDECCKAIENSLSITFKMNILKIIEGENHEWPDCLNGTPARFWIQQNLKENGYYRYPNFPNYKYLLYCDIRKDKYKVIKEMLIKQTFDINIIHKPYWKPDIPEWDTAFWANCEE